jgi:hypothetical protein
LGSDRVITATIIRIALTVRTMATTGLILGTAGTVTTVTTATTIIIGTKSA